MVRKWGNFHSSVVPRAKQNFNSYNCEFSEVVMAGRKTHHFNIQQHMPIYEVFTGRAHLWCLPRGAPRSRLDPSFFDRRLIATKCRPEWTRNGIFSADLWSHNRIAHWYVCVCIQTRYKYEEWEGEYHIIIYYLCTYTCIHSCLLVGSPAPQQLTSNSLFGASSNSNLKSLVLYGKFPMIRSYITSQSTVINLKYIINIMFASD